MSANVNVVFYSLEKARTYLKEANYGRAFAHYLVVLQLSDSEDRKEIEEEFLVIWSLWSADLFQRKNYENLINCHELVHNYFPRSNNDALNNYGVQLLRSGDLESAKLFFEAACRENPKSLPYERNLMTTKYALVERWHFRMLNDAKRNQTYMEAIKKVKNSSSALDIGIGTGLLSLFAARCSPESIVGCDSSETMCAIAEKVIKLNNIDTITVVNEHSSHVEGKFELVITEIFDSGVFGENILQTLIDTWERLLEPGGKVLPSHVKIYVSAISNKRISSRFRTQTTALKLNTLRVTKEDEPYDSFNLKGGDTVYLTEHQECLKVDFNDLAQLKTLLKSYQNNPLVELKAIAEGVCDAFSFWFKLYLNDDLFITNDPRGEQTCWEQAIINVKHPITVGKGDSLNFRTSCVDGVLKIQDLPSSPCKRCFTLPSSEIALLNDSALLDHFNKFFKSASVLNKNILDLSRFPLFGLLALSHGASLFCNVKKGTIPLIKELCFLNALDFSRINFVSENSFNETKYDIVVQNLIEASGLINENDLKIGCDLVNFLNRDGVFLPRKVVVWGQLVCSEWLDRVTRVDDRNCCGLKIAEVINEYKTLEQRDIDISSLEFTEFSSPIRIGPLNFNSSINETKTDVEICQDGMPNAILYWFELSFCEGESIFTRREGSFANISAFMIEERKEYRKGDRIEMNLRQEEGILKLYL